MTIDNKSNWVKRNWEYIVLLIVVIAMIIAVGVSAALNVELAPVYSVVLVAGLIGVTVVYAFSTGRIATATREHAKASLKMAEQMKEQRYSECLPLLAPTILQTLNTQGLAPNEVHYVCLQSGMGIKVMWCNVGKGVAINSRFSFWTAPTSPGKATFFPLRELGTVEVEGKKEVDYSQILNDGQLHDISDAYQPRVEAEYLDIYERKVTTVQKFRIDEQNERALLGVLYFTVNGRRLGEEITRHD
jgi:hypothetical protein